MIIILNLIISTEFAVHAVFFASCIVHISFLWYMANKNAIYTFSSWEVLMRAGLHILLNLNLPPEQHLPAEWTLFPSLMDLHFTIIVCEDKWTL